MGSDLTSQIRDERIKRLSQPYACQIQGNYVQLLVWLPSMDLDLGLEMVQQDLADRGYARAIWAVLGLHLIMQSDDDAQRRRKPYTLIWTCAGVAFEKAGLERLRNKVLIRRLA